MKFDRNTVIGIVVLALLFIGYFWTTNRDQAKYQKEKAIEQARQDSIAKANAPKVDSTKLKQDSLNNIAVTKKTEAGQFQSAGDTEKIYQLENDLLKISFTTKGGQPKKIELKKYNGQDSFAVKLASTDFDKIDYPINTLGGSTAYISQLNFKLDTIITNPDNSKLISFKLSSDSTRTSIKHQFVIKPNDYMIDFTVAMNGANKLISQNTLNLIWQYKAVQQESDISFEKTNTQIGYLTDG